MQKSNFGDEYYINYGYYIGSYTDETNYPSIYDIEVMARVIVMSKKQTIKGKCFLTGLSNTRNIPKMSCARILIRNLKKGFFLPYTKEKNTFLIIWESFIV